MKILVTAFDPFGGEKINPAFEAVKKLEDNILGNEIIKLEIPTVFKKSVDILLENINKQKPDCVLCVGQAGGRFDITVERVGINIDDARIEDNEGNQPIDVKIYEDGENAYFSNLPIKSMVEEMKKNNIPASISNTAGTFVCNHILYSLMYHIDKNKVCNRGGFIHVPFVREQVIGKLDKPYMEIETITKAITYSIKAICSNDIDVRVSGGVEF